MDKQTGIYNYFNQQPPEKVEKTELRYIAYGLIGVGTVIIFLIFFQLLSNIFAGIAIAAFVVAGIVYKQKDKEYETALAYYESSMPDSQMMTSWFSEDLNDIVKKRAFQRFDLDQEKLKTERYLIMPVPYIWNEPGVSVSSQQKGMFYSAYWVTVLFLTKNYVSVFTCVFDWTGRRIAHEETNEFFYSDISSIKTGNIELDKPLQSNAEQKVGSVYALRIINVSGHTIDIFSQIPRAQAPITMDMNQVVSRLRKMLRNRRAEEDPDFEIVDTQNKQKENDNSSEQSGNKN